MSSVGRRSRSKWAARTAPSVCCWPAPMSDSRRFSAASQKLARRARDRCSRHAVDVPGACDCRYSTMNDGSQFAGDVRRARQRLLIDSARSQVAAVASGHASRAAAECDFPGAPRPTSFLAALPPDALHGYEGLAEIHRGGQGVVYRAIQKSTKRDVAIKIMREGPFAGPAD